MSTYFAHLRRFVFASPPRLFVTAVFLLALAVRIVLVVTIGDTQHPKMYEHGEIAENLYQGNGFSMHWPYEPLDTARAALLQEPVRHEGAFIPPLGPLVIYGSYVLFGKTATAVSALMLFNSVLGAFTVLGIYGAARRLGSEPAARIVASIASIFLPTAAMVVTFSGSVIYHLLAVLVVLVALDVLRSLRTRDTLALGLLCGTLTMARSEWLLLGIAVIVGSVLFAYDRVAIRRKALAVLLGLSAFGLVIAPWTIRNSALFHRFVPVVSHPWFEIWRGNNEIVESAGFFRPTYDWVNPREFPRLVQRMDSIPYDANFEPSVNDMFRQEVFRQVRSDPWSSVRVGLKKVLFFFTFDASDSTARSPSYLMFMIPLVAAVLVGLYLRLRSRSQWRDAVIPILILGYYLALTVATYTLPRYQIFLFTTLLPLAVVSIDRLVHRLESSHGQS